MKKLTIAYLILAAIFVVVLGLTLHSAQTVFVGNVPTGTATTFSSSSASTTVATILAANTGAQYRSITNKLGGIETWFICGPTSTNFIAGTGRLLSASTSPTYEMSDAKGNLCTDTIYSITKAGTTSIATEER